MDIKHISVVTDQAFSYFLQFNVDTRLEAYTVFDADGVWQQNHEPCKVMEILCSANSPEMVALEAKIKDIVYIYNKDFDQECVMVTRDTVQTAFI
jgi:hypothetical protein